MCTREVYGDPCSECGAFVRNGGLGKTWCRKAIKAGRACKDPQTIGEPGHNTGDHVDSDKDGGVDDKGGKDGTGTGATGGVRTAKPQVLCDDCRGGQDGAKEIQDQDLDQDGDEDDCELPAYPDDTAAAANADVQDQDQPGQGHGQDTDVENEHATISDNDSDGGDHDDDEYGPWNKPWAADPYTDVEETMTNVGGADYDMDDTAPLLAGVETEHGQLELEPEQHPGGLATAGPAAVPDDDGGNGDDEASDNEVYYTPREVYYTPREVYYTPREVYYTPREVYYTPREVPPPCSPAAALAAAAAGDDDNDDDDADPYDDIDDGAEEDDDTAAELARRITNEMERARVRALHEQAMAMVAARRDLALAMERVEQWCRDVEEQTAPAAGDHVREGGK